MLSLVRNLPLYARFVGGGSLHEVKQVVQSLDQLGLKAIVDYAVEDDAERIDDAFEATMNAIETFPGGKVAVKMSAFGLSDGGVDQRLLNQVCDQAFAHGSSVLVDAEQSFYQDDIDAVTDKLIEKYNTPHQKIVYKTYQLYRHDRLAMLEHDVNKFGNHLAAKLVRGAYLNEERSVGSGVCFEKIKDTHAAYDAAVKLLVETDASVHTLVATHNETSCKKLLGLLALHPDKGPLFSCAQLLGMNDDLSEKLAPHLETYKYVPYGPFFDTVPYLLRRLRENYEVLQYV